MDGSGTQPTIALQYHTAKQEDEVATSKSNGPKHPGSLYKCRKGAAANLHKYLPLSRILVI